MHSTSRKWTNRDNFYFSKVLSIIRKDAHDDSKWADTDPRDAEVVWSSVRKNLAAEGCRACGKEIRVFLSCSEPQMSALTEVMIPPSTCCDCLILVTLYIKFMKMLSTVARRLRKHSAELEKERKNQSAGLEVTKVMVTLNYFCFPWRLF